LPRIFAAAAQNSGGPLSNLPPANLRGRRGKIDLVAFDIAAIS
jgi:hypothetical protein